MSTYNTDDLGYSRLLVKTSLFENLEADGLSESVISNVFSDSISPGDITSGELNGNLNVVQGYLQSSNFVSGVNGWKFDALGNLEANTGIFRGSLYASVGNIGDWIIDTTGLYYDGTGTPSIRTASSVGTGSNGVLLDKDGIKVYDSVLGCVVNLPSDGSAPSFSSGTIQNTVFEINTNAVLRTSETVGDGSANSAGVLINNTGFYACEANQILDNANIRITNQGDGHFKGTINASEINSSEINGAEINGSIITGGLIRTAESGQRTEIDNDGIELKNGSTGAAYSDITRLFNDSDYKYGDGVLGYINNSTYKVPFYINAEQTVADLHLYNRTSEPTGAAEIGDLCVVNGRLKICTVTGTPGGWEAVGAQDAISSFSTSLSPSVSPSLSQSLSPSLSSSLSPSKSSSLSPSISPSLSLSVSPSKSVSQSISPSLSHSISPSLSPSQSPSNSISPSVSPSLGSNSPSLSPSLSPSISPSKSKSASLSPSLSPSLSSSLSPSLSPSLSQSISPSISPSASPSEGTYLVDSYGESYYSTSMVVVLGGITQRGQSFTGDGGTLDKIKFYLSKYGSPTGSAYARIYSHSGTYGTSSIPTSLGGTPPTYNLLATSDAFDVSTLSSTEMQLKEFTFSGDQKITLEDGTYYVLAISYTGGDTSNRIYIGADNSTLSHSGNYSSYNGWSWSYNSSYDIVFYVYKD